MSHQRHRISLDYKVCPLWYSVGRRGCCCELGVRLLPAFTGKVCGCIQEVAKNVACSYVVTTISPQQSSVQHLWTISYVKVTFFINGPSWGSSSSSMKREKTLIHSAQYTFTFHLPNRCLHSSWLVPVHDACLTCIHLAAIYDFASQVRPLHGRRLLLSRCIVSK